MKFPNLNLEIDIIKNFLASEEKLNWFTQQYKMDFNADVQLALTFMIGFFILNISDSYRRQFLPGGKKKHVFISMALVPLTTPLTYYCAKLILYWTLWIVTLGWWFFPTLLLSALIFAVVLLLIIKFIDK